MGGVVNKKLKFGIGIIVGAALLAGVILLPINHWELGLNYALVLTGVRLRDYVVGSLFGMLPGTFLYVYLGSLVTNASELLRHSVGCSGEEGDNQRASHAPYFIGGLVAIAGEKNTIGDVFFLVSHFCCNGSLGSKTIARQPNST